MEGVGLGGRGEGGGRARKGGRKRKQILSNGTSPGKSTNLLRSTVFTLSNGYPVKVFQLLDRVKQKSTFEHVQNALIQIILCMHKVSSRPLLSIHTFCSIQ